MLVLESIPNLFFSDLRVLYDERIVERPGIEKASLSIVLKDEERRERLVLGSQQPSPSFFLGSLPAYAAKRRLCSWRAIKVLTISTARSVCGPGSLTHMCSQPAKISNWHSPPAAR